jgi:CrcB protein
MSIFVVGLGGMIGAIARYFVYLAERSLGWQQFPLATLFVNVLGSLLAGMMLVTLDRNALPKQVALFATMGFLGSFTTFSTLAVESFAMANSGRIGLVLLNLFLNFSLGLMAVWVGWKLCTQG